MPRCTNNNVPCVGGAKKSARIEMAAAKCPSSRRRAEVHLTRVDLVAKAITLDSCHQSEVGQLVSAIVSENNNLSLRTRHQCCQLSSDVAFHSLDGIRCPPVSVVPGRHIIIACVVCVYWSRSNRKTLLTCNANLPACCSSFPVTNAILLNSSWSFDRHLFCVKCGIRCVPSCKKWRVSKFATVAITASVGPTVLFAALFVSVSFA